MTSFPRLHFEGAFDFSIVVACETISAHKLVLSHHSSLLRNLIANCDSIEIQNFEYSVVKEFIGYLYLGECPAVFLASHWKQLQRLAEVYEVHGLVKLCKDHSLHIFNANQLSSGNLVRLLSDTEAFHDKILMLFSIFDVDNSNGLSQNEFVSCLEALELHLTFGEMVFLFEGADESRIGHLKFDNFEAFFCSNLLNLERERHIRMLQSSMHVLFEHRHLLRVHTDGSHKDLEDALTIQQFGCEQQKFIDNSTSICKLYDPLNTGLVSCNILEYIFNMTCASFIPKYWFDVLLSEMYIQYNEVYYEKSIAACLHLLLKVFCKMDASNDVENIVKVDNISQSIIDQESNVDKYILEYLEKKMKRIVTYNENVALRYNEYYRLLSSTPGLTRFECNVLIKKLLIHASYVKNTDSPVIYKEHGMESDGDRTRPTSAFAPGVVIPNMRVVPSSFTGVFSTHDDLVDAVFEARKASVMRGLLESVDSSTTQMTITVAMKKELVRLKEAGEIAADSKYLPVQSCFSVLENAIELRLNRGQILYILSRAHESFDKDGQNLEVENFAKHATSIIATLKSSAKAGARINAMEALVTNEKKILNGILVKDIEAFFVKIFNDEIIKPWKAKFPVAELPSSWPTSIEQIRSMLLSIGKLKVTGIEANIIAIVSCAPHNTAASNDWNIVLPYAMVSIISLWENKYINFSNDPPIVRTTRAQLLREAKNNNSVMNVTDKFKQLTIEPNCPKSNQLGLALQHLQLLKNFNPMQQTLEIMLNEVIDTTSKLNSVNEMIHNSLQECRVRYVSTIRGSKTIPYCEVLKHLTMCDFSPPYAMDIIQPLAKIDKLKVYNDSYYRPASIRKASKSTNVTKATSYNKGTKIHQMSKYRLINIKTEIMMIEWTINFSELKKVIKVKLFEDFKDEELQIDSLYAKFERTALQMLSKFQHSLLFAKKMHVSNEPLVQRSCECFLHYLFDIHAQLLKKWKPQLVAVSGQRNYPLQLSEVRYEESSKKQEGIDFVVGYSDVIITEHGASKEIRNIYGMLELKDSDGVLNTNYNGQFIEQPLLELRAVQSAEPSKSNIAVGLSDLLVMSVMKRHSKDKYLKTNFTDNPEEVLLLLLYVVLSEKITTEDDSFSTFTYMEGKKKKLRVNYTNTDRKAKKVDDLNDKENAVFNVMN